MKRDRRLPLALAVLRSSRPVALATLGAFALAGAGGLQAEQAQSLETRSDLNVLEAEAKPEASPEAEMMQIFELGAGMLEQAREQESFHAMIAAVDLLQRVRVSEDPERFADKTEEGTGQVASAEAVAEKSDHAALGLDEEALLAYLGEATVWAEGDEVALAQLESKREEVSALAGVATMGHIDASGRPVPFRHIDQVNASRKDVYDMVFQGGRRARLLVLGDGDTDLDLHVFDQNGNLIASDVDLNDRCVVEFTPRWTDTFKVQIRNLGNVYNRYTMLSN